MSLLFTLFPFYLAGNLHCLGMCGPLVAMLGRHRFRYWYFLGRLFSYTVTGLVAASIGLVIQALLHVYFFPALVSLLFGIIFLAYSLCLYTGASPFGSLLAKALAPLQKKMVPLLLKDTPLYTFLFGALTVLLPCGQTLIVFSACALSADSWVGGINGFAFALLTSPSLFFSLNAQKWLKEFKHQEKRLMIGFSALVGVLSICRGLADLSIVSHFNISLTPSLHFVLF